MIANPLQLALSRELTSISAVFRSWPSTPLREAGRADYHTRWPGDAGICQGSRPAVVFVTAGAGPDSRDGRGKRARWIGCPTPWAEADGPARGLSISQTSLSLVTGTNMVRLSGCEQGPPFRICFVSAAAATRGNVQLPDQRWDDDPHLARARDEQCACDRGSAASILSRRFDESRRRGTDPQTQND